MQTISIIDESTHIIKTWNNILRRGHDLNLWSCANILCITIGVKLKVLKSKVKDDLMVYGTADGKYIHILKFETYFDAFIFFHEVGHVRLKHYRKEYDDLDEVEADTFSRIVCSAIFPEETAFFYEISNTNKRLEEVHKVPKEIKIPKFRIEHVRR